MRQFQRLFFLVFSCSFTFALPQHNPFPPSVVCTVMPSFLICILLTVWSRGDERIVFFRGGGAVFSPPTSSIYLFLFYDGEV